MLVKISRAEVGNVLKGQVEPTEGAGSNAERQKASEAAKSPQGDTLNLSSQAQEIQRLRQFLDQVPDVREDQVQPVAEAVASGKYRVEADKVADQMVARMLGDKLV